jgi:hypothetical protein
MQTLIIVYLFEKIYLSYLKNAFLKQSSFSVERITKTDKIFKTLRTAYGKERKERKT